MRQDKDEREKRYEQRLKERQAARREEDEEERELMMHIDMMEDAIADLLYQNGELELEDVI